MGKEPQKVSPPRGREHPKELSTPPSEIHKSEGGVLQTSTTLKVEIPVTHPPSPPMMV